MIIFTLCAVPNFVEGYLDRKGETRKGKVKDTIWLIVIVVCALGLAWWLLDVRPFKPALLLLGYRIGWFDYIANWFLKHYSEGHKDIDVFEYTGTTTYFWDQWMAKIEPYIRFVIRLAIFIATVIIYFI